MSELPSVLVFAVVGILALGAIWGFVEWARNNKQPQISYEVRVVAIDGRSGGQWSNHNGRYAVNINPSFRIKYMHIQSGEVKEIVVPSSKFVGRERVGNSGILTMQGTRYISFWECDEEDNDE